MYAYSLYSHQPPATTTTISVDLGAKSLNPACFLPKLLSIGSQKLLGFESGDQIKIRLARLYCPPFSRLINIFLFSFIVTIDKIYQVFQSPNFRSRSSKAPFV